MKKVLVTGASGWIGRYCVETLKAIGFNVHEYPSNLLDRYHVDLTLYDFTHLLHLAWNVKPGYWDNPENIDWFTGTARLIEEFHANGGKRIVVAGTQADLGQTLYGRSKAAVKTLLEAYNVTGLSSAYGRIHCLYGIGEKRDRLIPSIILHALKGEQIPINHPQQILDYLYVEDVADALCVLLDNDETGSVDIGSGHGITTLRIAQMIAEEIGVGQKMITPSNIPSMEYIVADCRRISKIWRPRWELREGLEASIEWWKNNKEEAW